MQVSLDHIVLIRVEIFQIPGQKYASALGRSFWLRNESLAVQLAALFALVLKLFFELTELCWQEPSLRKKLVVLWEDVLHPGQVPRQMVFASQSVHAREVVNALIGLHAVQFVHLHGVVSPKNVPFVIWILVVSHVRRS